MVLSLPKNNINTLIMTKNMNMNIHVIMNTNMNMKMKINMQLIKANKSKRARNNQKMHERNFGTKKRKTTKRNGKAQ